MNLNNSKFYLWKANQLLRENKLSEAIIYYQKAIDINPCSAWSYYGMANAYAEQGEQEKAIDIYRRAVNINPDSAWFQHSLGKALLEIGSVDAALESSRRSIELNNEYYEFFHQLGKTLFVIGNISEAIKCYHSGIKLYSNSARLYYSLAIALETIGNFRESITYFQKVIQLQPNFHSAYNKLRENKLKLAPVASSTEKYIICKGKAGLGNRLYTLSHAIKYAKQMNRKLIVEWNDCYYSSHPDKNVFYDYFHLINLDSSYRNSYDIPDYKKLSVAPLMWKKHLTKPTNAVLHGRLLWKLKDEYYGQRATIVTSKKYAEDIVVFTAHNPPLIQENLLEHVRLQPNLEKIIDEFVINYFSSKVVGLHVRWTDKKPNQKIDILFDLVDSILDKEFNVKIYIATDNIEIIDKFQKKYGNLVIFRQKWFPASSGETLHHAHQKRPVEEIFFDALIGMFLLSRCNYLIYQDNSSFSHISACYSIAPKVNITSW
ncbi:MAG: tetratricopeptide repeat protein [Okeania sp. SIO1H6]|nr:tetratricopeptide repeat protein [Okeania sp. SIO1H6]